MPPTPPNISDSNPTTNVHSTGPVGPAMDAHPPEYVMDSIDRSNVTGNRRNMNVLCQQFPTLVGVPGSDPFDAQALHAWVRSGAATGANRHAVRFVLQVWNPSDRWPVGPFNVVAAFATWDDAHRAAFLRWATAPWFP